MEGLKACPRCGSNWFLQPSGDWQHYWLSGAKGKPGSELDLAGLVCNSFNDPQCPNPCKGQTGGQTWASRQALCPLMDAAVRDQFNQPPQQCPKA
jgi:hypothetical protein